MAQDTNLPHDPPPGTLRVVVTALEMLGPPVALRAPAALPAGSRVERMERPGVPFYRFLYDTVGEPWLWGERRRWSDEALAARIQDPDVDVWLLSADGQPAGFAEFDRRDPAAAELSYFGLLPSFIGRKLGPALLHFTLRETWASAPERVWVHTCDLDHPSALGLYRRAGFVPFRTSVAYEPDPRVAGSLPRTAAPKRRMAETDIDGLSG